MIRRKPWSTDPMIIMEGVNALIDGHMPVSLLQDHGRPLKSRILGVHSHQHIPYLLLARPNGLDNAYLVRDVLFKLKGMPVLGFSCPVTRASSTMLGTLMPHAFFSLELRQGVRVKPPRGAAATFFIPPRSQINIGILENISMGGGKLSGELPTPLGVNDVIGPCTLSLSSTDAVVTREVTVAKAIVTRVEAAGRRHCFGVKFELSSDEQRLLQEHLEFLAKSK